MKQGDIYFTSLDPAVGREQKGTRPVLIVSNNVFNAITNLPIVVPVTNGGNFARREGFAVRLEGYGLKTTGVVRIDQPRTADLLRRRSSFVERVPYEILADVLGRLEAVFKWRP